MYKEFKELKENITFLQLVVVPEIVSHAENVSSSSKQPLVYFLLTLKKSKSQWDILMYLPVSRFYRHPLKK